MIRPRHAGRRLRLAIAAGILDLLGACAVQSGAPRQAKPEVLETRAVRAAREAQNAAMVAGDADRIASFWTEDVSIRRAPGVMLIGRAADRALFVDVPGTVYQRHPSA